MRIVSRRTERCNRDGGHLAAESEGVVVDVDADAVSGKEVNVKVIV